MKIKKLLIAFSIMIISILSLTDSALAATKYKTGEYSIEQQEELFENYGIQPLKVMEPKNPIISFDVREDGYILLGTQGSGANEIFIYNPDGQCEYGFSFDSSNMYYTIWNGDYIDIFLVRAYTALEFDKSGEMIEVYPIGGENSGFSWNMFKETSMKANGYTFKLEKGNGIASWLGPSYPKLVKISPDGTREILYDVAQAYEAKVTTIFVLILCGIAVGLAIVIHIVIDRKKRYRVYEDKQNT